MEVSPIEYIKFSCYDKEASIDIVSDPQTTDMLVGELKANKVENKSSWAQTLTWHGLCKDEVSITNPILPLACKVPATFVDKNELGQPGAKRLQVVSNERLVLSDIQSVVKK